MSYRAFLEAKRGTLLGGVKTHTSCRFSDEEDAESWLEQAIRANTAANRVVGASYVCFHSAPAEIIRTGDSVAVSYARPARIKKV